jgi:prevent-host-death family protein
LPARATSKALVVQARAYERPAEGWNPPNCSCASRPTGLRACTNQIPLKQASSLPADEAKVKRSELLATVECGAQVVATRDGRPIARLVPERGHEVAKTMAVV